MSDTIASQDFSAFDSAGELRQEHTRLLEALDQKLGEDGSEEDERAALANLEGQIRQFLGRGAATGIYLSEIKDRTECQVLLDYWVSSLSRVGLPVSGVRLAKFDASLLPLLEDCPYVGLEAFRDQRFFFGREADTQTVIAHVRAVPLVVVLGASGSGKSSLVMGGVLPQLAAQEVPPNLQIVQPFAPGNAVLVHLVDAVQKSCRGASGSIDVEVERLRQDPAHLCTMVGGAEAPPTLITIDQFEEVFTLCGNEDRAILAASLVQFMDAGRDHRVILTMREEFRSRAVEVAALSPYLRENKSWYSMRPMGYEELRAAVERPAAVVNLQFKAGIVDDLVKKVLGQPAALPLLQFTLRALWEKRDRNRITRDAYDDVGDPLNALSKSADRFFNSLLPEAQNEVQRILLELVRVDELLEAYRQPVLKSKLLDAGKANTEHVLGLLAENDYVRITKEANESGAIVEIKHESLVRNWPRFVEWIEAKRVDRKQRFALTQAAERWAKGGKPREGLLTGWQLQQAKQQAEQQADLSSAEIEFIDESAKAIERVQQRKQRIVIGSFTALLLLGAAIWAIDHFHLQPKKQEWQRTWGELDFLGEMGKEERKLFAENRLDGVAIYLWNKKKKDGSALDTLVAILREADGRGYFEADTYQNTEWSASEKSIKTMIPAASERTIVTLEHPKGTRLSGPMLQLVWKEFSPLVWDLGFPLPATIGVAPRDDNESKYRVTVVHLNSPELSKATLNVPGERPDASHEQSEKPVEKDKFKEEKKPLELSPAYDRADVLLSSMGLESAAKELLDKHATELNARKAFGELNLSNWWWVPRWTIPIWKAAGHKQFYPPEVAVAVHAIVMLQRQPEYLYSDGFIAGVLRWQATVTPETVKAACETTGGSAGLINKVKRIAAAGTPLSQLQYDLEKWAEQPVPRSRSSLTDCDFDRTWGAMRNAPATTYFAQQLREAMTGAFKPEPPLRVYIAKNLQEEYIAPTGTLAESVGSGIANIRGSIEHDLGFRVPGVRFSDDPELAASQFRIKVRNETGTPPSQASSGREVDDILERLHERLIRTRRIWIDMEEVARLVGDLPPELADWLSKRYTRSELQTLLRKILAKGVSNHPVAEANEVAEQLQDGATLAHLSWLIRSLALWEQYCPSSDHACLAEGLRKTQKARFTQRPEGDLQNWPLVSSSPGIDSLVAGKFDQASQQFKQRLSESERTSVIEDFLQTYAKTVAQTEYRDLERTCNPEPGRLADHEKLVVAAAGKISAFHDAFSEALAPPQRRVMELCRISSQLQQTSEAPGLQESIDRNLVSETDGWKPNDKYWLSYLALKTYLGSEEATYKAPPPRFAEVDKLLSEAIRDLPLKQADSAFEEINNLCSTPNAGAWCLQMLARWPKLKQDSYWIPWELAYVSSQLSRDGAHLAPRLVDQAERNLASVQKDRQQEQRAWLAFARGLAHQTLADFGVEDESDKAIRYFLTAAKSRHVRNGPGTDLTYATLAAAYRRRGDLDQAAEALTEGTKRTGDSGDRIELTSEQVLLLWSQGKFDAAEKLVKGKSDANSLFLRCLSRMFSPNPIKAEALEMDVNAYLKSSHQNRDYVRLIYYWTLMRDGKTDKAKKLLEDRWKEIEQDRPYWQDRLRPERGDYLPVWREKLIGYYQGHVTEEQFSDLMENQSKFEASPFNKSAQSRQGYLCEWYFYNALFQSLNGDPNSMGSRLSDLLTKAVNTKQVAFIEYSLAKNLIGRIKASENLTLSPQSASASR